MALIPALILLPEGARLPNSNFAALNKVVGTNIVYYALDCDQTTAESAYWLIPTGDTAPTSVAIDIFWTAASGSGGVRWDIIQDGTVDNDVLDAAGTTVSVSDTLSAAGDTHRISVTGTAAEFKANGITAVKIARAPSHVDDTLAADARILGVIIRLS